MDTNWSEESCSCFFLSHDGLAHGAVSLLIGICISEEGCGDNVDRCLHMNKGQR